MKAILRRYKSDTVSCKDVVLEQVAGRSLRLLRAFAIQEKRKKIDSEKTSYKIASHAGNLVLRGLVCT